MKIIAYIFSIYFLLISFTVCCSAQEGVTAEQLSYSTVSDHAHHQHENGVCSPFCHCYCCVIASVLSNTDIVFYTPHNSIPDYLIDAEKPAEITYAIWQPPKLAANHSTS